MVMFQGMKQWHCERDMDKNRETFHTELRSAAPLGGGRGVVMDVFYLPPGWWHHVQSTPGSVALHFYVVPSSRLLIAKCGMLASLPLPNAEVNDPDGVIGAARDPQAVRRWVSSWFEGTQT